LGGAPTSSQPTDANGAVREIAVDAGPWPLVGPCELPSGWEGGGSGEQTHRQPEGPLRQLGTGDLWLAPYSLLSTPNLPTGREKIHCHWAFWWLGVRLGVVQKARLEPQPELAALGLEARVTGQHSHQKRALGRAAWTSGELHSAAPALCLGQRPTHQRRRVKDNHRRVLYGSARTGTAPEHVHLLGI
jgi:hypothetical protein